MSDEVSPIRPWVRYWARVFDVYQFSLIVGSLLPLVGFVPDSASPEVEILYGMIVLFAWVLVESVLLSVWGTTPGKWLLRVGLTDINGSKPTFHLAFERSLSVWIRGLGLGVPVVAFVANIISYRQLVRHGTTWWDRGRFIIRHETIGSARIAFMVLFFISTMLLAIIGNLPR